MHRKSSPNTISKLSESLEQGLGGGRSDQRKTWVTPELFDLEFDLGDATSTFNGTVLDGTTLISPS